MEFFFTTPNSTRSPSAEKIFNDCPVMIMEKREWQRVESELPAAGGNGMLYG
jgi:hypothetical protein